MHVRNLSLYTQTRTELGMHVIHTTQAYSIDSLCTSIDIKMSKLTWTTEMERVLLQSMVEQVRSGKRAESGFKKEAWVISVDQVKVVAKLPDMVTMKKAKDKLDTLKTKWNIWWKLRYEVSGWGWNEITQLFEASPEQWERYTEVCLFSLISK